MLARESFLDQLPVELDEWQRRGLIGAGQARRILALYGLAAPAGGELWRQGRLATLAGILGAALTGVGVILFVASNWQRMDRPLKVALLLGMLVAAYGVGNWLKFGRGDRPRVGEAFIFLGSIIFGANIFLIAQMYHVRVGEPLLLAAWSVGAFGAAYTARSRGSLYLGILAALAWYPFQLVDWQIERLGSAVLVGLAGFLPIGVVLMSAGDLQRSFRATRSFAAPFVRVGLVVALATVWVFSFGDLWRYLGSVNPAGVNGAPATTRLAIQLSYATFVVLALLLTAAAVWRVGASRESLVQAAGAVAMGAASLLAVSHPFDRAPTYAVVFNLVLLAGILWAILVGLWAGREAPINIGLIFFVLFVAARYFDFFFSLMDRSLAFIVGGAILLGGGYLLERSRRQLVRTVQDGEEQSNEA